jgi:hypothetical protein
MVTPDDSSEAALTPATLDPGAAAMAALRFRIPGDTIARATQELPDEQRILVRWFAGYCRSRNLSPDEVSKLLLKDGKHDEFYSWASIYAVLTGKRAEEGASILPVVNAIEALKRKVEGESRIGSTGFIETRLSRAIFQRFHRARERRRIAFIIGDSQLGKSESGIEFTRQNNHGETIMVDSPVGGSKSALLHTLCDRLNIGQSQRLGDVEMRVADCFDRKMLLILDNVHRLLRNARGLQALTFIQWLYDLRGCGIGLMMTNEGHGNLLRGRFAKQLEQLWRRRIPPLILPTRMPDDDLALFAERHGLEPAPDELVRISIEYVDGQGKTRDKEFARVPRELQAEVVQREGLGIWLETLEEAKYQARLAKRQVSWKAVLKAHCVMQADSEALL